MAVDYKAVLALAKEKGHCTVMDLQRHFQISLVDAAQAMDVLERDGVIASTPDHIYNPANGDLAEQLLSLQFLAAQEADVKHLGFYDEILIEDKETISRGLVNFADGVNIYIGNKQTLVEKVIVLAHEIGHAIDYKRNYSYEIWCATNFSWGYLMKEKEAWRIAVDLLHRVGFTEWECFLDWVKVKGLGSYYRAFDMTFNEDFLAEIQHKINSKER